jgi:CheY-like chemotaxis protein/HPt (histidine-containing phosphotransfer) domain-containing protein
VDDNAAARQVLDYMLRRWEMHPTLLADPRQAIPILQQAATAAEPYALAILDNRMPHFSGDELARLIKAEPQLAEVPLVMLTSTAERGDAPRMAEAGFSAFLVKPVRQETLLHCILNVLGAARSLGTDAQLVTQHTLTEQEMLRLRALLVDDNPINLTVGERMLEKAGISVTKVVNGEEAVRSVAAGQYDVVLMDMHMPVLDGVGATEAIRKLPEPKCHVPIIAMTASATDADRQRCLAAGMNDFVTKPVQPAELMGAIQRACQASGKAVPETLPPATAPAMSVAAAPAEDDAGKLPPIDIEASIERAGDPDFWQVLVDAYFDETAKRLADMRSAMEAGDLAVFTRGAHTIKGSSAEIVAEPMRSLAYELELIGKTGDLAGSELLLTKLESEFIKLQGYLDAHRTTLTAA